MKKGDSTFSAISHVVPSSSEVAQQSFKADMLPVIAAINALGEKLGKEIRVDLPAMNPTFTVPDFPEVKMPPITITIPEFPPFPTIPEFRHPPIAITMPEAKPVHLELSYPKIAMIACIPPTLFVALQWGISWLTRIIVS